MNAIIILINGITSLLINYVSSSRMRSLLIYVTSNEMLQSGVRAEGSDDSRVSLKVARGGVLPAAFSNEPVSRHRPQEPFKK